MFQELISPNIFVVWLLTDLSRLHPHYEGILSPHQGASRGHLPKPKRAR